MGNYDMIEAFQNLTNIGWGNVIVTFLFFIVLIIGLLQSLRYIHDFFGIETKQTLKEKKRDEDIKDFKQKIDDLEQEIKELRKNDKQFIDNRVHDREQSFEIQKNLMNNLSAMSNVLSEIKVDILEEKMERKRWNILNLLMNSDIIVVMLTENDMKMCFAIMTIMKKLSRN